MECIGVRPYSDVIKETLYLSNSFRTKLLRRQNQFIGSIPTSNII